jgi:anti-sigma factor RsiW
LSTAETHPEDRLLARYLRGELSEEQEVELEKGFFRDEDLFERFLAVEADLLDAYARGEMPAPEREQFERRLLSTPRRRGRAEFAKIFAGLTEEARVRRNAVAARSSFERSQSGLRRALGISLAIAAALLVGVGWLLINIAQVREDKALLERQREALQREVTGLKQQALQLQARAEETPSQAKKTGSESSLGGQTETSIRSELPRTVSFLLTALLRDTSEANTFSVPPGTETVVLKVVLEAGDYSSYSALIQTTSGANVWRRDRLRSPRGRNGKVLVLELPARLLPAGEYVLELRGQTGGKSEEIAGYSFRIVSS